MSFESETAKWWPKKRKQGKNHQGTEKINPLWIKEFIGDPRLTRNKLAAWESAPQMGMDKIRATTNMGKYFVDFASNSSVHGVNHLTAPHRHPIEIILTIAFIVGALATSILLCWHFWGRYQNNATILILNPRYKDRDFKVTIPSLVLCPRKKIDETRFEEVFNKNNITDNKETRDFFSFIADATYSTMEKTPNFTEVLPVHWLKVLWELKFELTYTVLFDIEEPDIGPTDWIITEDGFCLIQANYVTLYQSYDYWMANNWTIVNPPSPLPSRTYFERDRRKGLSVDSLTAKLSVYYPLEVPELNSYAMQIYPLEQLTSRFDVQETITSENVKSLSVTQKRCKTMEEGGLRLSPVYTHNMCVQECKYEIMRKLCNCYPHFVRKMPGVAVCSPEGLRCVGRKRAQFEKISYAAELECGCYPNCDNAVFQHLDTEHSLRKEGSPNESITLIQLKFPRKLIVRELLFGFNDFLAAVGGAFGLFLGASFLSFAEIIDFLTIRLYWYARQLSREKKADLKRKQKVEAFFKKNAVNIQPKMKY